MVTKIAGIKVVTTQEWEKGSLDKVLSVVCRMKKHGFGKPLTEILKDKTFFMFFYN